MSTPAKGGRYHHGDLRAALVDAAVALIAERGVREFSLAEASRRVGVSAAAPYRHFADREDLLAAVAVRAVNVFAAMIADEGGHSAGGHGEGGQGTPPERLAGMARAYVRFAAEQRPLFDVIFGAGIDKSRYPELQRAWLPIDAQADLVLQVCEGDVAAADSLTAALEATAHGHAALLRDGEYGSGPDAVQAAADRAAYATIALIEGSRFLRRNQ
jgi:AcrR family transcriptional regulator